MHRIEAHVRLAFTQMQEDLVRSSQKTGRATAVTVVRDEVVGGIREGRGDRAILGDARQRPPAVVHRHPGAARHARPRDHLDVRIGGLTRRERQVSTMVACGYSNRRIASECVLSLNTVGAHLQNVLVKLGVHSRLEAAAFAVARGIAAG